MITKVELEKLVKEYETEDFIKDDPVRFPNRFTEKKDIEIAGFIASLVAAINFISYSVCNDIVLICICVYAPNTIEIGNIIIINIIAKS